jgi:hypothetical protein
LVVCTDVLVDGPVVVVVTDEIIHMGIIDVSRWKNTNFTVQKQ